MAGYPRKIRAKTFFIDGKVFVESAKCRGEHSGIRGIGHGCKPPGAGNVAKIREEGDRINGKLGVLKLDPETEGLGSCDCGPVGGMPN
jgi:hypothetical protein